MSEVPYSSWAEYIWDISRLCGIKGKRLLDIACGTGNPALHLEEKGFRVWAFDKSDYMLRIFREKLIIRKSQINISRNSMQKFEYNNKFDIIVCLFDSLNYIMSDSGIIKVFKNISKHLKHGGIFIFDINSPEAYQNNIFSHSRHINKKNLNIYYKWDGHYDVRNKIYTIYQKYRKNSLGEEISFKEIHFQRAYEKKEILNYLKKADLEILKIYEAFTLDPINKSSERYTYLVTN